MENSIAIVVTVLVLGSGAWWVSHTRLVAARNAVDDSWADVDAELERRHRLIPRLVEAVGAAAAHEPATGGNRRWPKRPDASSHCASAIRR